MATSERAAAMRFIVCLGIVSLFADMTYEGAQGIIGPYLKELGATGAQVGLIAGLGEMCAASLRLFSGRLADKTGAYWAITILGYGVNVLAVPLLALAGNWQTAALLVVIERTGKALRGGARDVLLSEATAKVGHGWGFGLHGAFDQAGAMIGPLLMWIAVAKAGHFAPAFLWLGIPAVLSVTALLLARAAYPAKGMAPPPAPPKKIPNVFWWYCAAAAVLAFGYADFPLLSYHFEATAAVEPGVIPLLYAGAMGITGLSGLVAGRIFDRYGIATLSLGILISMLSLPLGFLWRGPGVYASVACWGIGLGVQDATLRAGVAQLVNMKKRGIGFGAFQFIFGIAWFAGSAVMGLLYDRSLVWLVAFGMVVQLAAALMFLALRGALAAARQ
jgi:MFS family permease